MTESVPLKLNPKEIEFPATFSSVTKSFKLDNPSDIGVIFAIKTTAPKRYMVRPNIGYVPPKNGVTIKVNMNLSKDPKTDPKSDRFQVQSFYHSPPLSNPDDNTIKQIWNDYKGKDLFKQRIKARIIQDGSSATLDASLTNSLNVSESYLNTNLLSASESTETSTVGPSNPNTGTTSIGNSIGNSGGGVKESVNNNSNKGSESTGTQTPPMVVVTGTPAVKEMNRYSTTTINSNNNSSIKPGTAGLSSDNTANSEVDQLKRERTQLIKQVQELRSASNSRLTIGNILILLLTLIIGYFLAKIF